MYPIPFFFFLLQILHVSAQSPPPPPLRNDDFVGNFEPSLAVVTGVLAIMFTLTFVLLIYAKCFHIDLTSGHGGLMIGGGRRGLDRYRRQGIFFNRSTDSSNRFSGLDKSAIESLPLFRFSSLKGSKQGLECSVCLSKFEDIEILRLLPKCRHAFHIGCIDQWLEQHATCPLCRDLVSAEEELGLGFGNSFRVLNQSEVREDISLELYIEREEEEEERRQRDEIGAGSLRFNIGESFRKILKLGSKEKSLLVGQETHEKKVMSKFNHRILVSDVMFKSRWSNVSSSDFMVLNSEMVNSISSERFMSSDREKSGKETDRRGNLQSKKEVEENRSVMIECGRRSVSEITGVPRVSVLEIRENATAFGNRATEAAETEERRRRLWLPIARKTAQWFVNRERRDEVNTTQQHFNV